MNQKKLFSLRYNNLFYSKNFPLINLGFYIHFYLYLLVQAYKIYLLKDLIILKCFHYFWQEIFGHKKGGYSQKTNHLLSSPNVFYDKQKKKILKLVDRNSPVVFKDEINILRDCEHN